MTPTNSVPCRTAWGFAVLAAAALVVSGATTPALADGVVSTHRLSAALANEAVGGAVAACAKQGYSVTATIVDPDGVRQAHLRGDGAGIQTVAAAYDKAYTSIAIKDDSGVMAERAKTTPPPALFTKLPHMVVSQGALVIKLDNELIAAIGVSGAPGGDKDEARARAGIAAIRDRMK